MAQLFTFNLGTTGKASTTGYQFYDSAGSSLGARSTTGVTEFGSSGIYFRTMSLPAGAVAVVWDDTDTARWAVDDQISQNDKTGYALTSAYDAAKTASDASTMASSFTAIATLVTTVDTVVDAIKVKTDNLPAAPAAVSDIPTAAQNAAATRDVNNATPAANSLGAAVNSAASAGDPWATLIPGAYGAGTAGKIMGDNLNAPVGDVPTAAENALALLKYDFDGITGEPTYSPLNAMRSTRNDWNTTTVPGTRRVYKEDGTTTAFDQVLDTDPTAEPIVGVS